MDTTPADRLRIALAVLETYHNEQFEDMHMLIDGLDAFLTKDLIMSLVSFIEMVVGPNVTELTGRLRQDINQTP